MIFYIIFLSIFAYFLGGSEKSDRELKKHIFTFFLLDMIFCLLSLRVCKNPFVLWLFYLITTLIIIFYFYFFVFIIILFILLFIFFFCLFLSFNYQFIYIITLFLLLRLVVGVKYIFPQAFDQLWFIFSIQVF